jgi:hypothetical protein
MSKSIFYIFAIAVDFICWLSLGFILFYSYNSFGGTMTTRNDEVVAAWLQNRRAHAGNLSTDGKKLFSYALCIGDTFVGDKIAVDYTASVGEFKSMTTSCHVGRAKRDADQIMHPQVYEITDTLRRF